MPDAAPRIGFAGRPRPPRAALLARVRCDTPRASRLAAAAGAARRPRPAEGAAALGLATVGDLLEHVPRARREARTVAALTPGETATVLVEVRSITARPVRRRGMRPLVEATVADATGPMQATFFNQPWLASATSPARGWCCTANTRAGAASASPSTPTDRRGRRRAPRRSRTTRRPKGSRAPDPGAGPAERPALAEVVEPLPGGCAHGSAADARGGARGDALRAVPRRSSAGAGGSPSRSCCSCNWRCSRRRGARGSARARSRWTASREPDRALARARAAVHADRRPAGGDRDAARGARRRAAGAAAADGRGRQRQDGRGAVRDAAGRRARLPGGADGTDRDARRAALRDDPGGCSARAGDARAADRLDAGRRRARDPRAPRERRAVADRRHARADRGARALRHARRRRGRRAAPLRGAPARRARREGAARAARRTCCT